MATSLPRLPAIPESTDAIDFLAHELAWSDEDIGSAQALAERGLPPLATVRSLPFVLGVSHSLVNRMRRAPELFYLRFEIPRRAGTPRMIASPRVALKVVQRWLHEHTLLALPAHPVAKGFGAGASIFDNAAPHLRATNLLQTDLSDFFASVRPPRVTSVFAEAGFPEPVAAQLTDLSTLDGGLPQGAPTSPLLSNLAVRDLDEALTAFATARDAVVTRYADDIAVSSDTYRFGTSDVETLRDLAAERGFTLNLRKTRIVGGGFRHVIAGVSTSRRLQYSRSRRRAWRALFHRAAQRPSEFTVERRRLLGIAAAVAVYDQALGERYRVIASRVPGQ